MLGYLFQIHSQLDISHGILDSSEDYFGKLSILESSLKEMERGVTQLNSIAILSEERLGVEYSL